MSTLKVPVDANPSHGRCTETRTDGSMCVHVIAFPFEVTRNKRSAAG